MRIFSDEATKIPEIKYWLSRHKALMSVRELSSYRNVYPLQDGRKVLITSIDGIDNISISKQEKKSLKEFQLPRELRGRALIYTAMANQTTFPPSLYGNLARLWGSQVVSSGPLPRLDGFSLVFIASPSRLLTADEATRLTEWKTRANGKIIVHLGLTSLAEEGASLWGLSTADGTILYATDQLLTTIGSKLQCFPMWILDPSWTGTTINYRRLNRYADPGRSYYASYLLDSYSGTHKNFNFLGNTREFIVDGGTFSIYPDASVPVLWQTYANGDLPVVFSGINTVLSRAGFSFPLAIVRPDWGETASLYRYSYHFDLATYYTTAALYNSMEALLGYWNEDYEDSGWDTAPVIAYENNIMVSATGNGWFSSPDVLSHIYANAEFILSLLLLPWPETGVPFKPIIPLTLDYGAENNLYGLSSSWQVDFYSPIS